MNGPSPDDTIEILETKHAEAKHAHDEALRTLDQLSRIQEELRIAIARKRGTCLCATQRHESCQRQRGWCLASDCLCDTCAARSSEPPLNPQDTASWAAFLPTVRVDGSLPVTFRLDGEHVLVEVIVPYVPPEPQPSADPTKIPLAIAEGFPVPVAARFRLPAYSPIDAAHVIRHIVREIYHHEIDEQLRVDGSRPFAPEHADAEQARATPG